MRTREDLLVEATFHNPYAEGDRHWSHGFRLGSKPGHAYWVGFESTGTLGFFHRLGSSERQGEFSRDSNAINTEPGESNLFQVIKIGNQVLVYINGKFQVSFLMEPDTGGDWVEVYVGHEEEGTTVFEGLTVWAWSPEMVRDFPGSDHLYQPPP